MQPRCPHCHQTLPAEPAFDTTVLHPGHKRIFDIVKHAGPSGISASDLFDLLYQEDPNGGPLTALNCLHVRISILNRKVLRPAGKEISSRRGRYGAYVLRDYKVSK